MQAQRKPKPCLNCGFPHTRKSNHCSPECGMDYMLQEIKQLHEKQGPHYERWKKRWEAATGLKLEY